MLARRTTRVCLFVVFGIHSIYMLGQDKVLSSLVQASLFGQGQIFVGRIAGPIKSPLEGEALPTVPVTVDEYLRGVKVVGEKIDLMVDGTAYTALRPPMWLDVEVRPGRQILVIMPAVAGLRYPSRVLDLDSADGKILLPIVRRIIAADYHPPEERKETHRSAQRSLPARARFCKIEAANSPRAGGTGRHTESQRQTGRCFRRQRRRSDRSHQRVSQRRI